MKKNMLAKYQKCSKLWKMFNSQLVTEANNDDFFAKLVRLQRHNHRFIDVNYSKTVSTSALLPKKSRNNPCKK